MTTLDGPEPDVAVIIPAAGAGTRLRAGVPKALCPLAGEPLLVHAVRQLTDVAAVGWLVVAAPRGQEGAVRGLLHHALPVGGHGGGCPQVVVVTGGAHRQGSVAAALPAVPDAADVVLVHDAARALAPASLIESVAAAIRGGSDAVVPVLPVTDTIIQRDPSGVSLGHLDRSLLAAVQTPQGFRRGVLVRAHEAGVGAAATDDAGLVARLGVRVDTVPGSERAFKITTAQDLALAELLLDG